MSVHDLPHLNAALNALAGTLLTIGYFLIRAGRIPAPRILICVTRPQVRGMHLR